MSIIFSNIVFSMLDNEISLTIVLYVIEYFKCEVAHTDMLTWLICTHLRKSNSSAEYGLVPRRGQNERNWDGDRFVKNW